MLEPVLLGLVLRTIRTRLIYIEVVTIEVAAAIILVQTIVPVVLLPVVAIVSICIGRLTLLVNSQVSSELVCACVASDAVRVLVSELVAMGQTAVWVARSVVCMFVPSRSASVVTVEVEIGSICVVEPLVEVKTQATSQPDEEIVSAYITMDILGIEQQVPAVMFHVILIVLDQGKALSRFRPFCP